MAPCALGAGWAVGKAWCEIPAMAPASGCPHLSQAACSCEALSYLWSKSPKCHNPWWRNLQSSLVYLNSPGFKLWWFIICCPHAWCSAGRALTAAEGAPVKVVTFALLTSVVTVPARGVKYSQISADAPGKENCWRDPQNGRFCLGRWWLRGGLGGHRGQQPTKRALSSAAEGQPGMCMKRIEWN